jgi:hypothetical protein
MGAAVAASHRRVTADAIPRLEIEFVDGAATIL